MMSKKWMFLIGGACATVGAAFLLFRWTRHAKRQEKSSRNEAFMFIKPHGQVPAMRKFVLDELKAHGVEVSANGELGGVQIDREGLIDAHYAAIALYAMKTKPTDLPLEVATKEQFQQKYGKNWDAACKKDEVMNLAQVMTHFKASSADIKKAFEAAKGEDLGMKLMPGCYVALLKGYKNVFVVNGFYGEMRSHFTDPSAKVSWFAVSWDEKALSWSAFRSRVLGATDPTRAEESSIRAKILAQRGALGLTFTPNTGTNCVHASASPLEALNERLIWLRSNLVEDSFATALLRAGFTEKQIRKMLDNPTINGKPLFDLVEDTNTSDCVDKLIELKPKL